MNSRPTDRVQVLHTPRFAPGQVALDKNGADARATEAYRAAKKRYLELVQTSDVVADADPEDWHEDVARLFAAIDAGFDVHLIDRRQHDGATPEPFASFGRPFDPARPFLHQGAVVRRSALVGLDPLGTSPAVRPVWPDPRDERLANAYARTETFRSWARRRTETAHFEGELMPGDEVDADDPKAITNVLLRFARAGVSEALLKIVAQPKYMPPAPVSLSPGMSYGDARGQLVDALGYAGAHLEGRRDAVLAQERLPLADEYRVFVADGCPVTGAGCIEAHTPCDRAPDSPVPGFDPRVEGRRGESAVRWDPNLASAYARAAEKVAADFSREVPAMRDYVLDFAHAGDREPLLVEVNPLPSSGLYASDPNRLAEAVGKRAAARANSTVDA